MKTKKSYLILVCCLLLFPLFTLKFANNAFSQSKSDEKDPSELLRKARTLMKKEPNESIKYVNKALKSAVAENNKVAEADAYAALASIYFQQSDLKKSAKFFKDELKIREEIGNEKDIALVLYNLGSVYMHWGKDSKAIKNYEESLSLAKKNKMNSLMLENYNNLFNINYDKNRYKKSLEYFNAYVKIKDSSFLEKNKQKYYVLNKEIEQKRTEIKEKEAAIEVIDKQLNSTMKERDTLLVEGQKKDEAIDELNYEKAYQDKIIQNQRQQRNFLILGVALVLVIAFVLLRMYIFKKKTNLTLMLQNEEILQQKEEIEAQRDHISDQNRHITSSIVYAQRIQEAAMPDKMTIEDIGISNFIFYKPKDIVSGDFYWMKKVDNKKVIAAVDCTGHGVPGAFVSMLGISFLNEVIPSKGLKDKPADILNKLRDLVKTSLKQSLDYSDSSDGMDLAFCIIDTDNMKLQYAGAHNPLYYIRNNELNEIKATINPIGVCFKERPFENHEIDIMKGDKFYVFSDGYMDQFGGVKGEKFSKRRFKSTLIESSQLPLEEQKEFLKKTIEEWQGYKHEQIDDMLVMGFEI